MTTDGKKFAKFPVEILEDFLIIWFDLHLFPLQFSSSELHNVIFVQEKKLHNLELAVSYRLFPLRNPSHPATPEDFVRSLFQ